MAKKDTIPMFQHTATRRWLQSVWVLVELENIVSTHSHPKVAANLKGFPLFKLNVSTHSHPKVAAYEVDHISQVWQVSTHSHPKVAALHIRPCASKSAVSTHSHPKVAAQRIVKRVCDRRVSTHSHPKVAANLDYFSLPSSKGFNTQPPEGGCSVKYP